MNIIQIRIAVSPLPAGFVFAGRGFIDGLNAFLKKTCEGSCVGVVTGEGITLEARATSREEVTTLVDSYCDQFRREQRQVQVVIVETPKVSLSEAEFAAGASFDAAPVKLTKSHLMKLVDRTFLVSNLTGRNFEPVFAESVGSTEARAAQWERIRAAGADQRACHVFPSEAHFRQWWSHQVEYFRSQRGGGSAMRQQ